MSFLQLFIDYILHIDTHLQAIIAQYGPWTYALLFLIVFAETGFIVTPFLPGDSLLFAAGAFAATGVLHPLGLIVLLGIAAIMGDTINYTAGYRIGPRVFNETRWFINKEHLLKTEHFYETYGSKTIVLARFVPIIRTFAPFIAGIGKMDYTRFLTYNVLGGIAWVFLFVGGGYLFGDLPIVRENFSLVILVIIALSILPAAVEFFKHWLSHRR
ncbi:DedA family protein [Candidatus Woesearchaeota archaeon]|nr:DedA family protein [Candidatus Woesearchaeota archaeon]